MEVMKLAAEMHMQRVGAITARQIERRMIDAVKRKEQREREIQEQYARIIRHEEELILQRERRKVLAEQSQADEIDATENQPPISYDFRTSPSSNVAALPRQNDPQEIRNLFTLAKRPNSLFQIHSTVNDKCNNHVPPNGHASPEQKKRKIDESNFQRIVKSYSDSFPLVQLFSNPYAEPNSESNDQGNHMNETSIEYHPDMDIQRNADMSTILSFVNNGDDYLKENGSDLVDFNQLKDENCKTNQHVSYGTESNSAGASGIQCGNDAKFKSYDESSNGSIAQSEANFDSQQQLDSISHYDNGTSDSLPVTHVHEFHNNVSGGTSVSELDTWSDMNTNRRVDFCFIQHRKENILRNIAEINIISADERVTVWHLKYYLLLCTHPALSQVHCQLSGTNILDSRTAPNNTTDDSIIHAQVVTFVPEVSLRMSTFRPMLARRSQVII
jgi:hypothetical protein